jgi:hypothetical protein
MAKKDVSLNTVFGNGEEFTTGGHSYVVFPLKLKEIQEFLDDNLSLDAQGYNLLIPDAKIKVGKWLERKAQSNGKPLTYEQAMEDDWDMNDVKEFLRKLAGLSG